MAGLRALPESGAPDVLYVVDLSAFLWRFTSVSMVEAPARFARWLGNVIHDRRPARLAFADDAPGETFRHALLRASGRTGADGYKGDRQRAEGLRAGYAEHVRPAALQALADADLRVLAAPGFEADDVAATLASHALARRMRAVVVSGDRDLWQLVGGGVSCWDGYHDVHATPEHVRESLGVYPDRVADYFAIVGGKNNVPGVPRLGPAAASRVLSAFSLDEAVRYAGNPENSGFKLNPHDRSALREHAAIARLSLELTTLRRDAPVEWPWGLQEER